MSVNSELDIPQITIANAKKLLKLITTQITKAGKQAIMLWGSPGIGKSDLVRELAEETNREFVDIRLSTIDPVDLRGLPKIDSEAMLTHWLPPDFLPQHKGQPGILFLDEINAASPMIQASAYQLILDRKLGDYTVPEDWMVIAAGNRLSDRSVAYRLPTALANRFTHFEIIVSPEEWFNWAWQHDIDPFVISFLRHHPSLLIKFEPDTNRIAFPTPRSWAFASSFREARDVDLNLYYKGIQGSVGSSAAQQFLAFLKHRDRLADPDDVLEGRDYDPPSSPDAQYVMMGALINSLLQNPSEDRISHFFDYADQFTGTATTDYSVVLVKELITAFNSANRKVDDKKIGSLLSDHPKFKEWVSNNMEILK